MPAATTKTDLLTVTRKDFDKLQKLIADIPDDQAQRKRADDTSIKDIIAHRAHWIDLFLGWYRDGQAGRRVHIPAKGYKWNDLKSYNAKLRKDQADLGWQDAKAALAQAHVRLTDLVEAMTDAQLYGGPMHGASNAWTTGRWAEAAGPSHYRSAAKWIRACLRGDA
ncbi:ClbS/DfsB family four-helix bundle protein [Octadecabacter sp. G9-8]|uniref:ClbS/DfsB family four-helix bundle protein n=1 Tax=Octadecabacter dasysiphoniae TaxID=2909341 RepID=A0ABS9D1G7_9RHOB|nr:ClbS/DfsB family four-helix bundle protein [Octadecabacter dasysiphoniae]MCF2872474.1 ClbS/DfsB family four-helix bundle protein [Octadecabacter dasysiphoniae]